MALGVAQAEGDIMELGVGRPHTQFFFPLPAGPKPLLQHGDLGVPAFGPVGSPLEQPLAPCLGPRPHASTTGAFETPDPGVAASEELLDLLPKPSEARPAAVVERRLRHGEENRISGVFNGARCSELLSLEVPSWRFQAWQSFVPGCVLGQQNTRGCTSRQGSAGQGAAGREQAAFTGKRPVRGEIGLLLAPGH